MSSTRNNSQKQVWNLDLPWSGGAMSAKLWYKGKKVVVSVPELDLCCYGHNQSEATMRLFCNLLKYHNQLKSSTSLSSKEREHFELLRSWMKVVETKICGQDKLLSLVR